MGYACEQWMGAFRGSRHGRHGLAVMGKAAGPDSKLAPAQSKPKGFTLGTDVPATNPQARLLRQHDEAQGAGNGQRRPAQLDNRQAAGQRAAGIKRGGGADQGRGEQGEGQGAEHVQLSGGGWEGGRTGHEASRSALLRTRWGGGCAKHTVQNCSQPSMPPTPLHGHQPPAPAQQ